MLTSKNSNDHALHVPFTMGPMTKKKLGWVMAYEIGYVRRMISIRDTVKRASKILMIHDRFPEILELASKFPSGKAMVDTKAHRYDSIEEILAKDPAYIFQSYYNHTGGFTDSAEAEIITNYMNNHKFAIVSRFPGKYYGLNMERLNEITANLDTERRLSYMEVKRRLDPLIKNHGMIVPVPGFDSPELHWDKHIGLHLKYV